MKVVLAEFDKGLMLRRKREKLFSGNCPKKYPGKDVLEIVLKNLLGKMFGNCPKKSPGKDLRADGCKSDWDR